VQGAGRRKEEIYHLSVSIFHLPSSDVEPGDPKSTFSLQWEADKWKMTNGKCFLLSADRSCFVTV
jgi:hypothetical protein